MSSLKKQERGSTSPTRSKEIFPTLSFVNDQGEVELIRSNINPRAGLLIFSDREKINIHKSITDWARNYVNLNTDPEFKDLQSFVEGFTKTFYTPLFFEAMVILGNYLKVKYPQAVHFQLNEGSEFNAVQQKKINFSVNYGEESIGLVDFSFEYLKIGTLGFASSILLVLDPNTLKKEDYFKNYFFPASFGINLIHEKNFDPSHLLNNYFLANQNISDDQKYDALLDMREALLPGKTNYTALSHYVTPNALKEFLTLLDQNIEWYKPLAIETQNNIYRSHYKGLSSPSKLAQDLANIDKDIASHSQKGDGLKAKQYKLEAETFCAQREISELRKKLEDKEKELANLVDAVQKNKADLTAHVDNLTPLLAQKDKFEKAKENSIEIQNTRCIDRKYSLTKEERNRINQGGKIRDIVSQREPKQHKTTTIITSEGSVPKKPIPIPIEHFPNPLLDLRGQNDAKNLLLRVSNSSLTPKKP